MGVRKIKMNEYPYAGQFSSSCIRLPITHPFINVINKEEERYKGEQV